MKPIRISYQDLRGVVEPEQFERALAEGKRACSSGSQ